MDKDKDNSLVTRIYKDLKQLIVTNKIMQGTLLSEVETSERYSVSRSPVREVFRLLESEGLLTFIPRKGVQVTQISHEDLADAYEVRLWIECLLVAKAATRITEDVLDQLEQILEKMPKNPNTHEEIVNFAKYNIKFHDLIVHSAANKYAEIFLKQIKIVTQRAVYFVQHSRYQQSWAEHKELLIALKNHDAEKSEKLIRHHIERARDRVLG